METITQIIAAELGKSEKHVENVINLIDEGNTIPFIARYRKEATGALNDEQLRNLDETLSELSPTGSPIFAICKHAATK